MDKIIQRLPHFLVIGAGKSGTTSLDHYLSQHPDVFMARKEPSYFAIKNLKTINDASDVKMMHHYPNGVTKFENYLNLFMTAKDNQTLGEVSPIYLNSSEAAKEIKSLIPKVKLIAILRHPTERLFSRYLHLASENRAPELNDLYDKESIWHKRNDLVKEGYYGKNLEFYFSLFDKSQIKIIFYEDYKEDPKKIISSIYNFIGVSSDFLPDTSIQHNQSGFAKNKLFDKLIGSKSVTNKVIKILCPSVYSKLKNNSKFYKILLKLRNFNTVKPILTADKKKEITNQLYKNDIKRLEKLVDYDLAHWYN